MTLTDMPLMMCRLVVVLTLMVMMMLISQSGVAEAAWGERQT